MQSVRISGRQCAVLPACRRANPVVRSSPAQRHHQVGFNKRSTTSRHSIIAAASVQKVNEEQLEVYLQDRDTPLIVDFFATWCGPCVMLSKELEQVAEEFGEKVRVVKVDVDENPNISSSLQIQGLPTMVFIGTNAEKPALRTEGFLPADTIKQILRDEL